MEIVIKISNLNLKILRNHGILNFEYILGIKIDDKKAIERCIKAYFGSLAWRTHGQNN